MSMERFAPANEALKAGRRDEGIGLMVEELTRDPAAPLQVYKQFAAMLFQAKLYDQSEHWAQIATGRFPRDFDLWTILGVSLRRLNRLPEALKALDRAHKIDPKNMSLHINRGNVYNDMKNAAGGIDAFTRLVRQAPTNPEHQRSLGRAYLNAGDMEKAEMRFSLAVKLKPDYTDGWLDLTSLTSETRGPVETLPVLERAVAAVPTNQKLREALAVMLRRAGRKQDSEAYLEQALVELGPQGWIHYQLGMTLADFDRDATNDHLEKAVALEPENVEFQLALAESYSRTRTGDEAANLERAYQLLKPIIDKVGTGAGPVKVASDIFVRVADYDAADALGDFQHLGRLWASNGRHTALLSHLARVRTSEDRATAVSTSSPQIRCW